jgi:hypothetical protein
LVPITRIRRRRERGQEGHGDREYGAQMMPREDLGDSATAHTQEVSSTQKPNAKAVHEEHPLHVRSKLHHRPFLQSTHLQQ